MKGSERCSYKGSNQTVRQKVWQRAKRLLQTAICSGILCALMGAASGKPLYAADTLYVNCDVVRGRSSAEIRDDNITARFYRGEELTKVSSEGEWTKVQSGGKSYYVASRYLSETKLSEAVAMSSVWKYAGFSKINSGQAMLCRTNAADKKNKTVCVNAGHGTSGGSSVKTLCHPDGSPKVTSGTTEAGATTAVAVSGGMTFNDGTPEANVTLQMAKILKERLLKEGYDVLMIRESEDVQLDNIARTVLANNMADCHIALHWDSTSSDKGAFYMSVPSNETYRSMEPVASHWQSHTHLGNTLIEGLRSQGVKIFSGGSMEMDLTQTSYSTIPSVDIELGDKASDHSAETLSRLADGLAAGVNLFFQK